MKIIADENIAGITEFFAGFGELCLVPGRTITSGLLEDADVLLVRSVTTVDRTLLQNSRCRFVGTATSGTDHIDVPWLKQQGIHFGWARGCNADSVTDYVCSALAALSQTTDLVWTAASIGIAGCGEVGSRLASRCRALGMRVTVFDPFLPQDHLHADLKTDFDTILAQDIVSCHVPLVVAGKWPTWHMLGARELQKMSSECTLINTARGVVVDNAALLFWLQHQAAAKVVLDVWEGEPQLLPDLLDRVTIATPHIAGHSLEGKLRGTVMLYEQFCDFLGQPPEPSRQGLWPDRQELVIAASQDPDKKILDELVLNAYDIREDDLTFRRCYRLDEAQASFDTLRKNYRARREFGSFVVDGTHLDLHLREQVQALGYLLKD